MFENTASTKDIAATISTIAIISNTVNNVENTIFLKLTTVLFSLRFIHSMSGIQNPT